MNRTIDRSGRLTLVLGLALAAGASGTRAQSKLEAVPHSLKAILLAAGLPAAPPDRVVDLERQPEFFLHDEALVAESTGVSVEMGRLEKHSEPLVVADQPWEAGFLGFACVLQDATDGLYKSGTRSGARRCEGAATMRSARTASTGKSRC